jgi:hypothetical protein
MFAASTILYKMIVCLSESCGDLHLENLFLATVDSAIATSGCSATAQDELVDGAEQSGAMGIGAVDGIFSNSNGFGKGLLAAKGGSSMDSPCNSSFTSSALALFLYL